MRKRYTIEVIIEEGSDEFWDEIAKNGSSGVEEVVTLVKDALYTQGFDETNSITRITKMELIKDGIL